MTANQGTKVRQLLNEAILNEDEESTNKYLKVLPIERLSYEKSNDFLISLLALANRVKSYRMVRVVVQYWQKINPMEDQQPIIITLLMLRPLTDHILPILIGAFIKTMPYYFYLIGLINQDPSVQMKLALAYLHDYFGFQDKATYEGLLDHCYKLSNEGKTNPVLEDWLNDRVRDLSDYQDRPEWVKNFDSSGIIPLETELPIPPYEKVQFDLPDSRQAAIMMTEGLKGIIVGNDLKRSQRFVAATYKTASLAEKIEMLQPYYQAQASLDYEADTNIFRILGPANPMVGISTDLSSNRTCSMYGGCRMFTCLEFANYDNDNGTINEDGYEGIEWFTGICQNKTCKTPKIRNYWDAVRMPMQHGGWDGCYCSWPCVRGNLAEQNPLVEFLINQTEKQMKAIGIQERRLS